jgi:hypothetical protein
MTTVFSNPRHAAWGRRLAFLAAIAGVWLLARGPITYGPRAGQHDYAGAWIMTICLLVIALAIELVASRRRDGEQ